MGKELVVPSPFLRALVNCQLPWYSDNMSIYEHEYKRMEKVATPSRRPMDGDELFAAVFGFALVGAVLLATFFGVVIVAGFKGALMLFLGLILLFSPIFLLARRPSKK